MIEAAAYLAVGTASAEIALFARRREARDDWESPPAWFYVGLLLFWPFFLGAAFMAWVLR